MELTLNQIEECNSVEQLTEWHRDYAAYLEQRTAEIEELETRIREMKKKLSAFGDGGYTYGIGTDILYSIRNRIGDLIIEQESKHVS